MPRPAGDALRAVCNAILLAVMLRLVRQLHSFDPRCTDPSQDVNGHVCWGRDRVPILQIRRMLCPLPRSIASTDGVCVVFFSCLACVCDVFFSCLALISCMAAARRRARHHHGGGRRVRRGAGATGVAALAEGDAPSQHRPGSGLTIAMAVAMDVRGRRASRPLGGCADSLGTACFCSRIRLAM